LFSHALRRKDKRSSDTEAGKYFRLTFPSSSRSVRRDPFFDDPERVENDYYRFRNHPRAH
jgi:hypothetical protein